MTFHANGTQNAGEEALAHSTGASPRYRPPEWAPPLLTVALHWTSTGLPALPTVLLIWLHTVTRTCEAFRITLPSAGCPGD